MAVNTSAGLSGAASGAAVGAAVSGPFAPVGAVVGGLIGGVAGLFSGGNDTPKYQPLDIAKVIADARTSAAQNYADSFSLEQQYNPQQAALRTTTNSALSNLASGNTPGQIASNSLLDQIGNSKVDVSGIGSGSVNPLLAESTNRILANLRLGGALGPDVQAQTVQAALEKGGAAGISGSGAARGLVARDLGLTSLGLEKDRIAQAQAAGTTQAQLGFQGQQLQLNGQSLQLQDFLQRLGLAQTASGQDTQRTDLLSQIVDSRALPSAGLDPGSIASLYVGNSNAGNSTNYLNSAIAIQQRNQNLNSLLGLGSVAKSSGATDAIANLFKPSSGGGV